MADWHSIDLEDVDSNGLNSQHRRSSQTSGHLENKENKTSNRRDSHGQTTELSTNQPITQSPGSANTKVKTSKTTNGPPPAYTEFPDSFTIPSDGNISSFTCDQLAAFFKCFKVDERIISHLKAKSVDGKRFAKMKDSELDSLGINNPVVMFFRSKSSVKTAGRGPFML